MGQQQQPPWLGGLRFVPIDTHERMRRHYSWTASLGWTCAAITTHHMTSRVIASVLALVCSLPWLTHTLSRKDTPR